MKITKRQLKQFNESLKKWIRITESEKDGYGEPDENFDKVKNIPAWATTYIAYGDDTAYDLTSDDYKMVDEFEKKLNDKGWRFVEPIEDSYNEFCAHPAFGDACDTYDWVIGKI